MISTHAGLFEGIGAFSLGARRAGLTTAWVSEINPYKKARLRHHFKNTHIYGNIYQIQKPPYADILTGGFPCQDISVAGGKSGIFGVRSQLWHEFFRIICQVRPPYVVIENSTNLRNKGFEYILHDLSQIGYDAQWECLRACEFGYPHTRERLFIIAYPSQVGRRQKRPLQIFGKINEVLGRPYRQVVLPVPVKRVHPHSSNRSVHRDYGVSPGLDRPAIAAIGDAVLVDIAEYLFKCILKFHEQTCSK